LWFLKAETDSLDGGFDHRGGCDGVLPAGDQPLDESSGYALGASCAALLGQQIFLAEGHPDRTLEGLARDARPAVAAELAVLRRTGVVPVQVRGREVLDDVQFNEHGYRLLPHSCNYATDCG